MGAYDLQMMAGNAFPNFNHPAAALLMGGSMGPGGTLIPGAVGGVATDPTEALLLSASSARHPGDGGVGSHPIGSSPIRAASNRYTD
jgi:hypothetical protein